jgi:hypothetical protein
MRSSSKNEKFQGGYRSTICTMCGYALFRFQHLNASKIATAKGRFWRRRSVSSGSSEYPLCPVVTAALKECHTSLDGPVKLAKIASCNLSRFRNSF